MPETTSAPAASTSSATAPVVHPQPEGGADNGKAPPMKRQREKKTAEEIAADTAAKKAKKEQKQAKKEQAKAERESDRVERELHRAAQEVDKQEAIRLRKYLKDFGDQLKERVKERRESMDSLSMTEEEFDYVFKGYTDRICAKKVTTECTYRDGSKKTFVKTKEPAMSLTRNEVEAIFGRSKVTAGMARGEPIVIKSMVVKRISPWDVSLTWEFTWR
ncbi:unnamed protein product [Amoebophrya sp. A25]|nr:unnamed protein product [Amoebophrya sp. A25]|eukprot:GSA25T00003547001.1